MDGGKLYFGLFYLFVVAIQSCSSLSLSHENLVKHPGDMFLVTCSDEQKRALVWTGPSGVLSNKTNPRVEPPASYGTSLTFYEVTVEKSGDYKCSAGEDTKIFKLVVEASLRFVDTPETQFASEYTDAYLRCEVTGGNSGGLTPIITWSKEGNNMSSPKYTVIADGLVVRNVSRMDSGIYTCTAMQPSTGDLIEQKIHLKVQHKPVGINWTKEETVWGYMGGDANLTCEVLAEPPATFLWFWQKKTVHVGKVHQTTNKSILQVHLQDSKMFGNYMCKASNQFGSISKIFTLLQGVRPGAPDFIEILEATTNLATIAIHQRKREVGSEKLLGYGVQYRRLGDQEWKFEYFPLKNSYTLKDLLQDTDYEVKVSAMNPAGYGSYTNASNFRTLGVRTSKAPTSFVQVEKFSAVLIVMLFIS